MKILVINCGSSSLKYQLINMENEACIAQGLVERIGNEGSVLTQKVDGREKYIVKQNLKDHKDAIGLVLNTLVDKTNGVIKNVDEISAVGHRVVHGGEQYNSSVLIDGNVMKALEECSKLAPLHNPPNIIGINACKALMPNTPMVAVFDTAFHQTMPKHAYIYPLPYEFYEKNKIRKYGFHGTSHKYVSIQAAKMLNKDIKDLKIISCHLGNGASITAIKDGKSIDTSMGFTPLAGLAMGTRTGDMDPAIITYMIEELKLSPSEVTNIINKKSGVLGISGVSSDFRDIWSDSESNERAQLALDVFHYRIRTLICAYAGALGGVDCIIFTAGIGENSGDSRKASCDGLEFLGVKIDKEKNKVSGKEIDISTEDSKVKVLVIPTNEELMIARDTKEIVDLIK
ncbi:acetate kinase [Candidatus Clostridium radicumherbarum]|uniref:Acetate kinase n=1 Tax=Candidatus Clostridium radicumherbarum TaxID=3381662 RepID=A0ABW8TSJ2_9CLOT